MYVSIGIMVTRHTIKSYNFDDLSIGFEITLFRNGFFQKEKYFRKAGIMTSLLAPLHWKVPPSLSCLSMAFLLWLQKYFRKSRNFLLLFLTTNNDLLFRTPTLESVPPPCHVLVWHSYFEVIWCNI